MGVGVDSILSEKEEDFAKDRKDEKKEDPEVEKKKEKEENQEEEEKAKSWFVYVTERDNETLEKAESKSIEISDDEEECHSPMRKRKKVIYDSDEEMTIEYIDEAAKKKKKTTTTTTIKKRRRLRKVGRDSDSENMDRMYAVPETTAKEVNGESSSSSVIDLVSDSDVEEIFESRARKNTLKSDEFVVIELKVSRGPDRTLGQISYYIGWIKQNIAKDGQEVRGIIIANEITDELKIACSFNDSITLKEYSLSCTIKNVS